MPGWGQILDEIQHSARDREELGPDIDGIRAKYIDRLHQHSHRAVIVYASGWLHGTGQQDIDYLVGPKDVHAFMEACHEVPERQLDLILHSPGGLPFTAEQLVKYLRTQFDYIRAIVPLQAKSAATMIALGCDEIALGAHSELGPIDPQILMPVPGGQRFAPAHAILRDFQRAKQEIAQDVTYLPVWTPILHAYAGGLLEFCDQQIKLSQEVVTGWLRNYMLAHDDAEVPVAERDEVAAKIAEYFGSENSYDRFREHGRPVRIEDLQQLRGLRIRRLEDDNALQDAVLSIYHVLDFSFGGPAVKIVENHRGRRYVRVRQQVILQPIPEPDGSTVLPVSQQNRGGNKPTAPRPPRPKKRRR